MKERRPTSVVVFALIVGAVAPLLLAVGHGWTTCLGSRLDPMVTGTIVLMLGIPMACGWLLAPHRPRAVVPVSIAGVGGPLLSAWTLISLNITKCDSGEFAMTFLVALVYSPFIVFGFALTALWTRAIRRSTWDDAADGSHLREDQPEGS